MCHICDRLGIVIEVPSPEHLKKEAAEEEQLERAREQKKEDEARELIAQGKPLPTAPRKVLIPLRRKLVVEPAPSHDGAPSFAAYQILVESRLLGADLHSEDGSSNSPPSHDPQKHRAKIGIRTYDTTANATADRAGVF